MPADSDGSTAIAASIDGGAGGGFAGFGKGVGSEIEVDGIDVSDLGNDPYFTMFIQSNATEPLETIAEVGTISDLTHAPQTIALNHSFINPVVFINLPSYDGSDPGAVRITDVQSNEFTAFFQEPAYRDEWHTTESVSYMVFEAGSWELEDGTLLEVGTVDTDGMAGQDWASVGFCQSFADAPAVLSQVQTDNEEDLVVTRQNGATADGFQVATQEEEALISSGHAPETIGWLAMSSGSGSWDGRSYAAGTTPDQVTDEWYGLEFGAGFSETPNLLGSIASFDGPDYAGLRYQSLSADSVQVKVEEEASKDAETNHTTESLSFFAIEGTGKFKGIASL